MFGYVNIDEYQLDLIPLDKDILSLELPEFFRSYYLVGVTFRGRMSAEGVCQQRAYVNMFERSIHIS